jgi:type I restriction enzyme, S subunit
MACALYREWFVHFRFPRHEKFPRVDSALGDIPQGWAVKPLGEVATVTMGLSPKGSTYNDQGDGTPLVNGPVEFGERFTRQVKWTTAPAKLCREGDLVVCVRGSTTGRNVKSDGVYCLGRGVCGLSSKHQCFVDLLFKNELPTLLGQTRGSTFPSWTGPQLKSHAVLCPSSELLAHFEVMVKPMSAAVLDYSRQIQNLRRTRDVLLPRLLSGKVNFEERNG